MVAVALSIAVHEVLAGFVRSPGALDEERETVRRVTIARIETPRPSPTPKPTPTPPSRAPVAPVHAAIRQTAAATKRAHDPAAPRPLPVQPLPATPAVAGTPDAVAAGAAQSTGDGTSTAPGGSGDGAGTVADGGGNEPCGAVDFLGHGSHYDAAAHGYFVAIRLVVHFPDGHAESLPLDYPFFYASAAENPFSEQNRDNPGVPVVLQTPPPALAAAEPSLLQYVVKHTAAEGFTLLARCPATAAVP